MSVLRGLQARFNHWRRMRQSRAAVRRAERAISRRARLSGPGYDELRHPVFVAVMALAMLVLMADLTSWILRGMVIGGCA
ncbi:MAG: hypothetical protein AB7P37_21165 [Ramlibacter sp.]